MSGLNNALSPRSTTRTPSMESMQTSSYEHESEESDEWNDMSPNQERSPQAFVCQDQEKDQFHPIIPIRESDIIGASRSTPNSPDLSYYSMKSDQSMKEPLKFNQGPDMIKNIDPVSPTSTMGSVLSVQSIDPPNRFSGRESCTSLMIREHLRCSRCKNMLKEPVTIPCGHSFCRNCIESFWSKISPSETFPCPQCRKRFKSRPALNLNFTLANVVLTQQHSEMNPAFPQSAAGPGDVACDSCSGRKIKAVKSCLTCHESFCEAHVRQHYTEKALQKHTLKDSITNS